ncbi:hypothetical protein D3C84_785660 [compost metagenome]
MRRCCPGAVVAVKRPGGNVVVELRAVGRQLRLQVVEHRLGQAAGVAGGLHHQRWHRRQDRRLAGAVLAVAGQVMHHLAAAGGMSDMHCAAYPQVIDHRRHVIGVMVHVVAIPDLAGAPVAAAVMGDNPITLGQEEQHLRIPVVTAERPTVVEENHLGIARAPVFIEDFNAVFGCDECHVRCSSVMCLLRPRVKVRFKVTALLKASYENRRTGETQRPECLANSLLRDQRPDQIGGAQGQRLSRLRPASAVDPADHHQRPGRRV